MWYKGIDLGDEFRQDWKKKIKFKESRTNKKRRTSKSKFWRIKENRELFIERNKTTRIESVIFVPSTKDGLLAEMVSSVENELSNEVGWRTKVLERSGTPLSMLFRPTFPSERGCALGDECKICDNDGIACWRRNVTYRLHMDCKDKEQVIDMDCDQEADTSYNLDLETVDVVPTYIGETSHPLKARAKNIGLI